MTARRSKGDGSLSWDESRQRWQAIITTGYTPAGKRIYRKRSARTKTAAQKLLKEMVRELDEGAAPEHLTYTVKQAVDDWLEYGLAGRDTKTKDTNRSLARNHVIPDLGKRKLRELSADDVDRWLEEKAKILSHRTLQSVRSVLKRSITRAQARDRVRRNVALLCDLPTGLEGRPSKSLTLKQAEALLGAVPESSIGAYIVVSLLTGSRTEELRELDWHHVDLKGNSDATPAIPPSIMVWRSVRTDGDTKTRKSRRTLALPQRCVDILKAQRKRQERARSSRRWREHNLVFTTEVGTAMDAANVRRAFRRVVKAAGLDPTEWTPRELRHSFVSLLSDDGVPLEEISRLVGHGGTTVTERVYRKQIRPVLNEGATAMDRIFGDA